MVLLAIEENYAISAAELVVAAEKLVYENEDNNEFDLVVGYGSAVTLETLRN